EAYAANPQHPLVKRPRQRADRSVRRTFAPSAHGGAALKHLREIGKRLAATPALGAQLAAFHLQVAVGPGEIHPLELGQRRRVAVELQERLDAYAISLGSERTACELSAIRIEHLQRGFGVSLFAQSLDRIAEELRLERERRRRFDERLAGMALVRLH